MTETWPIRLSRFLIRLAVAVFLTYLPIFLEHGWAITYDMFLGGLRWLPFILPFVFGIPWYIERTRKKNGLPPLENMRHRNR